MNLIVEWLDEQAWDDDLERQWSELVERAPGAPIFLTPEWVGTWWRHFGRGRLRLLVVRRDGRCVALVPLVERRARFSGVPAKTLQFAGVPQADRLGLVFDPDEAPALTAAAEALANCARSADVVCLEELTAGGEEENAIADACRRARIALGRRIWSRAPVLDLDRPLDEIMASYPKTLRARLKRARKRQAEAGGFAFRRWQPRPDEIPELLARLRDVEDRTWKGRQGVGIFSPVERWNFIVELSTRFSERGWLDIATLTHGSSLVAYRYGFRFRGSFLDYSLAHAPEADRFGPGRTLLDDVILDSHRLGLKAVDASRGRLVEPHLLADWTASSRWHSRMMLFGRGPRGRALSLIERAAKPLARRMLRRPEPVLGSTT